jgi:hypothetical protein
MDEGMTKKFMTRKLILVLASCYDVMLMLMLSVLIDDRDGTLFTLT